MNGLPSGQPVRFVAALMNKLVRLAFEWRSRNCEITTTSRMTGAADYFCLPAVPDDPVNVELHGGQDDVIPRRQRVNTTKGFDTELSREKKPIKTEFLL